MRREISRAGTYRTAPTDTMPVELGVDSRGGGGYLSQEVLGLLLHLAHFLLILRLVER